MKYTVTVTTEVSYDIVVEAQSFDDAAGVAIDIVLEAGGIEDKISEAVSPLVPDEFLNDIRSRATGIYRV